MTTTQNNTNSTSNINTYFHSALRYSFSPKNATSEEINMALGDPNVNFIPDIDPKILFNLTSVIVLLGISILIGIRLGKIVEQLLTNKMKGDPIALSPITWIKSKYYQYTNAQVLPLYRPRKAKESPFVGPVPPPILPTCPRLDGAEKGQNLQVRFSIPYRRFPSSDDLTSNDEHRITITTVVESAKKDPN